MHIFLIPETQDGRRSTVDEGVFDLVFAEFVRDQVENKPLCDGTEVEHDPLIVPRDRHALFVERERMAKIERGVFIINTRYITEAMDAHQRTRCDIKRAFGFLAKPITQTQQLEQVSIDPDGEPGGCHIDPRHDRSRCEHAQPIMPVLDQIDKLVRDRFGAEPIVWRVIRVQNEFETTPHRVERSVYELIRAQGLRIRPWLHASFRDRS